MRIINEGDDITVYNIYHVNVISKIHVTASFAVLVESKA